MKGVITILLLFIGTLLHAQQYMDTNDPKEIKSILNKRNELNGFGGASLRMGDVYEERTLIAGAFGGVLINRNFMLGVAGYGIATKTSFDGLLLDNLTPKKLHIKGGYAGVLIGGTLFSREVIHLNIPILIGAGAIYVSDLNFFDDPNARRSEFTIESSTCFVIEPGAEIEINLTRGLRFAAGATYRYVEGLELQNIRDRDLIDWTGTISLRFGRF